MSNTIKKFLIFLDENIENICYPKLFENKESILIKADNETYKKIIERENIKRILSIPKEDWPTLVDLFTSFEQLSIALQESKLKTKEKLEVIMYMFEKNLATKILDIDCKQRGFDAEKLKEYPFKYTNYEEVINLIYSGGYRKLFLKEKLTKLDELKLEEIEKAMQENELDISKTVEKLKTIKEHYFDKLPNLNEDDIKNIIEVFKQFNIDEDLLKEIEGYFYNLIFKIKKREKKFTIKLRKENSINVPQISEKEFNYLNRILKPYYDLDNDKVIRPLSLEEQALCIHILKQMKINEENINKILNKINKLNPKNSIAIYCKLYDKFVYYKNNQQIKESLNELEKYFKQIFICEDEDYEIIKMIFDDEIKKILDLIPKTYEYEYEEAKKITLIKK